MKLLPILLGMTLSVAMAAEWKQDAGRYRLDCPEGSITVGADAVVSMVSKDGGSADYKFFLWHDQWVYEILDGKGVKSLQLNGKTLQLTGEWSTHGEVPRMSGTLSFMPAEHGFVLRMELYKPEGLRLQNGVYATYVPRQRDGELYLATQYGEIDLLTSFRDLSTKTLQFGGLGKIGIKLSAAKSRSTYVKGSGGNYRLERCLVPTAEFDADGKAVVETTWNFQQMPATIPQPVTECHEPLTLSATAPERGEQYKKTEISVFLRGQWKNPYDSDEISLEARVTEADGSTYVMPGFFMVPHDVICDDGDDVAISRGGGEWKVRLMGRVPGAMSVTLQARDRQGTVSYRLPKPIEITPSRERGIVRASKIDSHYFVHDNGESFIPIGHNFPIFHNGSHGGMKAIRKMAEDGENWNRWWLSNSGLGIEWESKLGWYRQKQAALLDYILDTEVDMYYMICMDTHQDFRTGGWLVNPFNKLQGGPCEAPVDWFTNETAKSFYRKRLRYTVARWGYSQRVMCWEFGNEFEGWAGCPQETIIAWHREMAPVLAALDPYKHLISTSWWSHTGPEACWQIPELGIVQTHCYTNNDLNVAPQMNGYCREQWQRQQKPHIFAEFGIRSHNFDPEADAPGWGVHNAAWSTILSGGTGNAMPWWHENYIAPKKLGYHFSALRKFVTGVPFGKKVFKPLECTVSEMPFKATTGKDSEVMIQPKHNMAKPPVDTFVIADDGTVSNADSLYGPLQGEGHAEWRYFPTFEADFPENGSVSFFVERVSNSGLLKVFVDDNCVYEREFPCGEKQGKSWVWREQWTLWESVYNDEITLPVPAGHHRVRFENYGKDWMKINWYRFVGVRSKYRPTAVAVGMGCDDMAMVWLQNGDSTWWRHAHDCVRALPSCELTVSGLTDGDYRIERWDTIRGVVTAVERKQARGGSLKLAVPELVTDCAFKLIKQ